MTTDWQQQVPVDQDIPVDVDRKIDCHNHMLVGIDDGATNQQMSLQMAKVSFDCGVSDVVLTPHHGNGVFDNFLESVRNEKQKLQQYLLENNISLRLHLGSELHLTPELCGQLQRGEVLTYANKKKAALIELPKQRLPVGVESILKQCLDLGITPIIAHPERNSELVSKPDELFKWITWGCKTQLTAMSLTGRFGDVIQQVSEYWLTNGCAHIVASDAHRPTGRSPDLSEAYGLTSDKFGADVAAQLFYSNPLCLLEGKPLNTPMVTAPPTTFTRDIRLKIAALQNWFGF